MSLISGAPVAWTARGLPTDADWYSLTCGKNSFKDEDGRPLLDKILDAVGRKGMGRWTGIATLDLVAPLTGKGTSRQAPKKGLQMIFYSLAPELRYQGCVTDYPKVGQSFLNGRPPDISAMELPIRVHGMYRADAAPSHFETGLIPVFSTLLIKAFEYAGADNLQYVPAVIVGEDGTEGSDYHAVQVIGILRCCDLDAMEHEVITPGVGASAAPLIVAHEVQIEPSRVPFGLKMFLLAEQPSHLIASESVVDSLVAQRPEEGVNFIRNSKNLKTQFSVNDDVHKDLLK